MNDVILLPEVRDFLSRGHAHFIGGEFRSGASGHRIPVFDPATGEVLAHVASADPRDIDAAVSSAKAAYHGAWAQTLPYQRGVILNRFADILEQNGEGLAQLESVCSGKSIHLSRAFEVGQSAMFLRYYAGWATKINGETMTPSFPSIAGERYTAFTRREPVGVVAGIVPWNFSVMIAIWKIASALVTGCTVVIKPSEFTPFTLLRIAELAIDAGVPAGAFNVLNGDGTVGQGLIAHPDISKVSFTGSVPTGLAVGSSAMLANLTRVTLELGGKNAAALLEDVDVDQAVAGLVQTGYVHQGQVCAAPERVYVHRSRLDEVMGKVSAALAGLKIGSPLDESVQFGPLSNRAHFEKICHYFEIARKEGRIICGGKALGGPGYFVEPTAVLAGSPADRLLHEETFGPILCFLPFDSDEELLQLLNDSPYGLAASLWTNDLSKALRMVPRIEAGTVWINMHTFLDPAVPFGGIKKSGTGREFGTAFIDDYTELKSVMIRY
ncbi:aldehyde dehydrogenase family protein [Pseudomonas lalucatii]|uniref:Aldehyde dehydrogenase family protein n=1 Tax=Pseudomonas lalucatii TaxID=1424203 RepID=A0ABS5PYL0_9PSED|nr:aldehyde dehydrogenase family protein [Pseudomonas lalucatii]MBS7661590.1 aldehyde dehydrogenase family protein [Pseudomonas lalucatii]QVM88015.1 aldehyde dehydrogenase family protein [Pseudomonas lalucatii]